MWLFNELNMREVIFAIQIVLVLKREPILTDTM